MNRLCEAMLAEHGLTLAQWVVLSTLWRRDGLLVGDLARQMGSKVSAASRLIDRMERDGLVRRRADSVDGRAVRVHLTRRGRASSGLATFFQDVNDRLLEGFSEREAHALFAMLERVHRNALKAGKGHAGGTEDDRTVADR